MLERDNGFKGLGITLKFIGEFHSNIVARFDLIYESQKSNSYEIHDRRVENCERANNLRML